MRDRGPDHVSRVIRYPGVGVCAELTWQRSLQRLDFTKALSWTEEEEEVAALRSLRGWRSLDRKEQAVPRGKPHLYLKLLYLDTRNSARLG